MKLTKITRLTWRHPDDLVMRLRRDIETGIFMTRMQLANKSKHFYVKHIDNVTVERIWTDQESAEQYIHHQQEIAARYGGEIVSYEIRDIGM
jgi:hypothetical protein